MSLAELKSFDNLKGAIAVTLDRRRRPVSFSLGHSNSSKFIDCIYEEKYKLHIHESYLVIFDHLHLEGKKPLMKDNHARSTLIRVV